MSAISANMMRGIINAQTNIGNASQHHRIAESNINAGRLRMRQSATSGCYNMYLEGKELKAYGEEKKVGTFEHVARAMNDINTAIRNEPSIESNESAEDSYENGQEYTPNDFNVVVGDTVRGSVNIDIPSYSGRGKVDTVV